MPSQDPQNQPKYVLVIGKTTRQITQASKALEQNNTKAASSTLKFSCKMKVPQASVEESAKQVPLPKNKPRSVSLHDGLVQSTTHVSLPDVAFSENSTASQNVLLQNNTLASSPRYKFTCSMKVPRTITKESNMQAPLPKNKPCGLLFHDGLSPSNPQVILPGVASSDNSLMFQNIPEQNNVQAALPKNKFSCSMPSQDPQNHLKCVPLLLKPTQQITQASKESTELVSLDIAGKFQQWRTTLSTHPVDRRDGQDVKENKSLKSGETPSESDCVSLSLSNACSSNSEKNISIMKPHVDNNILQLKASTKDVIENEEVSYEQEVSSITGFDTDEVLVTYECIRNANKYIDVVCHVCASVVSVEKMLSMHLLFGHLKCKNCDLEVAGCSMMKTCFYRNSFCRGNKQQGKHDFTVWCSDVIEYILYHLKKDLIIKNFCKYDRNIPVCDNDLYSELQDYVGKLAILRKCCPWNSALHECDQYILSQKMSRKIYSVSNANTHPTDSAIENRRKADLLSFQDSRSLELICKKNETVKDFERDKAEFVRVTRKRGGPCLAVRDWDFPKDKRYLKISITGKHFSCPEECPECYFAICPSRFIMKVNDFTLKYTCVECHLPIFFVFEPDEEKYKKRKRVK
ncbi:uncharacterized protein [Macrobrachium rosenbergii]|uniref:uncharacterized protein n=1 Tax=Macrobrachium rosenbergii TaxID=79674 RepID=UPI0034D659FA